MATEKNFRIVIYLVYISLAQERFGLFLLGFMAYQPL